MQGLISKTKAALSATTKRFLDDRSGNFAVLLGILSPMLFVGAGLMLDTTRLYTVQAKLNDAIDAAVLATTQDLTLGNILPEDVEDEVRRWVLSNVEETFLHDYPLNLDAIIVDRTARTVEIEASTTVPMILMQIAGIDERPVTSFTKAEYSNINVEVAMALDVTGSMSGSKIRSLKRAAQTGIDELFPNSEAEQRIRVGLVPYASTVNIDPIIDEVTVTGGNSDCVFERTGSEAETVAIPDNAAPLNGASNRDCVQSEIVPLTNDRAALKSEISSLRTGGWTAGHLGITWTRYMLTAGWAGIWGADAAPSAVNTRKIAIIMTDGEFNTFLSAGPKGTQGPASNAMARTQCNAMKAAGITVYTIGFQLNQISAQQVMNDCATSSSTAYLADNEGQLTAAFREIARDINSLKLVF
ncbi:MAG: pilus assembly protein [Pseudomonadota bacterium]